MLFTISQLLARYGVDAEDTPYAGRDEVNSCVFDAPDFFKAVDIEKYRMNFAASRRSEAEMEAVVTSDAHAALMSRLDAVKGRLRELSVSAARGSVSKSPELAGEIRRLRAERTLIMAEIERLIASNTGIRGGTVLIYKDTVLCNYLDNMERIAPEICGMDPGRLASIPIFTRSFDRLPAKLKEGEPIAVEGGPCILGTGEMLIHVARRDGSSSVFDFNTGNYSGDLRDEDAVGPYIREYADEIVEIRFENRKDALMLQEYEALRLPMEFARSLGAPVIIPLPDVAYMKYIDAIASSAAPDVRESARRDFAAEMRLVSKLFLDAIQGLERRLSPPRLEVLHAGNASALEAFYSGRKKYYDRFISLNQGLAPITRYADMIESATDYIFYPALPFYLWGIGNIIQVDSISETDSLRKCAKAHGADITLFGVLYPEMLDKTGSRATSMAPASDKEYLR
ncbi:MAG: hypothetical protein LBQ56_01080 [Synergistaceae bacterium]|nr:hypothetical protein [Synergistaceae bacterium]